MHHKDNGQKTYKARKSKFQITPTPLILSLLVKLFSFSVFTYLSTGTVFWIAVTPASAYANEYVCGTPKGPGSVFYDFDKIVIYYSHFTHHLAQKVPNYPEELKYDNFSKLLLNHVEKSFKPCLSKSDGSKKPILIADKFIPEIADPKTLSIVIYVSYRMSPPSPPRAVEYGMLTHNLYRPGLTPEADLMLFRNNSAAMPIFPKMGEEKLRAYLEVFFKSIRPIDYLNVPRDFKQEQEPGLIEPANKGKK